jgi:cardiolipin synthase (CMP-forming)
MDTLNIPNTLTIMRILIIPLFAMAVIYDRYDSALYLFFAAAITDALDGLIARLTNQKTILGTFLDPLADKFLLVTSYILFSISGIIPTWLTITLISRDIILVTGWVVLYFVAHTAKVEPSLFGKIATAMQLILIWYVLLKINIPNLPGIQNSLVWITALCTVFSGLHYIYRGITQTNA